MQINKINFMKICVKVIKLKQILPIENIYMDLNVENYGIAPPGYSFTALSVILKIHGIAPEYKYYAIFLE